MKSGARRKLNRGQKWAARVSDRGFRMHQACKQSTARANVWPQIRSQTREIHHLAVRCAFLRQQQHGQKRSGGRCKIGMYAKQSLTNQRQSRESGSVSGWGLPTGNNEDPRASLARCRRLMQGWRILLHVSRSSVCHLRASLLLSLLFLLHPSLRRSLLGQLDAGRDLSLVLFLFCR